MRLETSDRVYRLQGRFIDRRGKENLVHIRYIAYGVFLATAPEVAAILWLTPGGPKLSSCIVLGLCVGFVAAYYLSNKLRGDITPRGFYETARAAARTWLACRVAAARAPRQAATRRPRTSRIRLRSEVPQ